MNQKRDLGLDVVRLLSLFAITIHHFIWVVWYTLGVPTSADHFGWRIIESYARSISFSGHTIIFMSSYLIARAETRARKTWAVVGFALIGWIIFCFFELGDNEFFWVWDVYPLIALGLASIALARTLAGRYYVYTTAALGILGLALMWIKFWEWPSLNSLALPYRQAIIGDCPADLADWPILPWIGIIWTGYALGTYAYSRKQSDPSNPLFSTWAKFEYLLWPALLGLGLPSWPAFYHIELGPQFACFSFRQEPAVFWGHFIFVLFLLRLSLLKSVNQMLDGMRVFRGIGNLMISRHFGLAYIIHYALIECCRVFKFPASGENAWGSFSAVILILPMTELLMRLFSIAVKAFSDPARAKN